MYKAFLTLEGTLDTVEDINKAIAAQTGDAEDFFEEDSEEWRAWVEYKDGKTVVLVEEA